MNTKTTPKDFFLHLAATAVLYAAVIALINLLFSLIDYTFPDKLASGFYSNAVAFPISMLVVLTPLLYVVEWLIGRDIKKLPEKASLWIRRWRIYLTLFLAGATIVGDLIAMIRVYLSGEITSRFIWKIVSIIVVCGVVFTYYLLSRLDEGVSPDMQGGAKGNKVTRNILSWAGIVIVLGAIVWGFVIVGSPAKQRAIRFDQQRTNDLSSIQNQVVNYWQRTAKMPVSISDLNDEVGYFKIPTDPESGAEYVYKLSTSQTATTTFELCAMFSLATEDVEGRGAYNGYGYYGKSVSMAYPTYDSGYGLGINNDWKHEKGNQCFKRTIDPSRYPPYEKPIPKGL